MEIIYYHWLGSIISYVCVFWSYYCFCSSMTVLSSGCSLCDQWEGKIEKKNVNFFHKINHFNTKGRHVISSQLQNQQLVTLNKILYLEPNLWPQAHACINLDGGWWKQKTGLNMYIHFLLMSEGLQSKLSSYSERWESLFLLVISQCIFWCCKNLLL